MRFCFGACVVLGLTTLAQAADQNASLPPAPALPSISEATHNDWGGFYIGVNAGYGGGRNDYVLQRPTASPYGSLSFQADGFAGGGQLGYNYLLGKILVGAEADFDGSNIDDKIAGRTGNLSVSGGDHLDYLGTIRGRLGYVFGPLMVYGTGGFAYGGETANLKIGTTFAGSATRTHAGYAFGGGVGYALAENVFVKAEYVGAVLDSEPLLSPETTRVALTSKPTVNVVRAGIDVHLASMAPPAPVVARY